MLGSQAAQNSALTQLVARCDTIQAGADWLRARLRESRQQLRLVAPNQGLSPAQRAATQLLRQLVAYRATLRKLDARVALPRLVPPALATATAPSALANFYFRNARAAEVLAALAQLEAAALTSETAVLEAQSVYYPRPQPLHAVGRHRLQGARALPHRARALAWRDALAGR